MAWDHLAVDRPHLVYIVLGGFTTLFMLCSSVIKEKLYVGEATVATLVGIIFGPHAANLIDPGTWGNTDKITIEFSRIVLVVQCFAVGVELPKAYMERHWRSVVFLLVPVMTAGWLITSLFIWGLMGHRLNWLDSLVCAACVTATDPVLASSVVGKGKFAKRVPKHLRDLLSAESGCNDGMAFPFIYLGLYIVRYYGHPGEVTLHWICITILYECLFGAVYGVAIGYIARRAVRYAHERDLIDRESFLVFYFVLALFCAGSGSILGVDDLLVGFAAGVGFSNDGWFTEKTEESHVSNVIDLLINLAFFVYFGTIIPWELYNSSILGTSPWRLVVIAILVVFFRRIPIMMVLKPVIPDIKTWREALFAGHFGPIGVGALFAAILARAELETDSTSPLADLPPPDAPFDNIIELVWPITTFLVLTSIIVHGSSIAVFTLGKHINTLTITMSYTRANTNEEAGNWMDHLPRIQSRSKSMNKQGKLESSDDSLEEKLVESPSGGLSIPRNFLRRQREEDAPRPRHRSKFNNDDHMDEKRMLGLGGAIAPSAIRPQASREASTESQELARSESDTLAADSSGASPEARSEHESPSNHRERETARGRKEQRRDEAAEEVYREGDDTIIEDGKGNVLEVMHTEHDESETQRDASVEREVRKLMGENRFRHGVAQQFDNNPMEDAERDAKDIAEAAKHGHGWRTIRAQLAKYGQHSAAKKAEKPRSSPERRQGPARAFRFGRTIIVEDEDGEVIKKYDIPAPERDPLERKQSWVDTEKSRQRLQRMGRLVGMGGAPNVEEADGAEGNVAGESSSRPKYRRANTTKGGDDDDDDEGIRFTLDGKGRRMSKAEFIKQIQAMDPKSRAEIIRESDVPEAVKEEAEADAEDHRSAERGQKTGHLAEAKGVGHSDRAEIRRLPSSTGRPHGPGGVTLVDRRHGDIPVHSVNAELKHHAMETGSETAAARRRRTAEQNQPRRYSPPPPENEESQDSDDDGTERVPPAERRRREAMQRGQDHNAFAHAFGHHVGRLDGDEARSGPPGHHPPHSARDEQETAAERRRREGALGISRRQESDSDESETQPRRTGIRFAESTKPRQ